MFAKIFVLQAVFALLVLTNSIWAQSQFDPDQQEVIDVEFILQAQRMRKERISKVSNRTNIMEAEEALGLRSRPLVRQSTPSYCTTAVNRLKAGPPNIPLIIQQGTQWTDTSFNTSMAVTWSAKDAAKLSIYQNTAFYWARWQSVYPNADIFRSNGSVSFNEAIQLSLGNCYFIQGMSSVAANASIIKSAFLTQTKNSASIYGVRFFIRGKPWVVAVDDYIYMQNLYGNAGPDANPANNIPLFAQLSKDNTNIWGQILEKAWGKVKGNYVSTEGGFNAETYYALSNIPVFTYGSSAMNNTIGAVIAAAYNAGYLMGAGTSDGSDKTLNQCGIAFGHAYSLVTAFNVTAANGTVISAFILRNPWGTVAYNLTLNPNDTFWTTSTLSQVPLSISATLDPVNNGIIIVPASLFSYCFAEFYIGHYRDNQGYNSSYYDQENAVDQQTYTYTFTAPSFNNPIYFMADTYPENTIDATCYSQASGGYPTINMTISTLGSQVWMWYGPLQFPYPGLVSTYSAGQVFTITVQISWQGSPIRDFTVRSYSMFGSSVQILDASSKNVLTNYDGSSPSAFTNQQYCGMSTTNCGSSTSISTTTTNTTSGTTKSDQQVAQNTKVNGLLGVFQTSSNINQFFLFIWYNPWVLFVFYNFGLW